VLIKAKPAQAAIVALALFAVTGCSQETTGIAGPATGETTLTPPAPSSTVGDQAKAPTVKKPLDASKFIADPCLVLTQTQIQTLEGSKPGTRTDSQNGPGCQWNFTSDGSAVTGVNFVPAVTDGLSQIYQQNAAKFFKDGYFEPVEIEGYPAAYNSLVEDRASGNCGLAVGISDQILFGVLVQWRPGQEACKGALNVAKEVLHTIQGSQ
jgi:hypothetical protein